ncbi:prepilin peptidase, partial [Acinetobacter baumannii]
KIVVLGLVVPFLAEFSVTMARRYRPEMTSMDTFERLLPMSTCDGCGASLGWRALPFLQMLFGRGRCACCGMKIDRS